MITQAGKWPKTGDLYLLSHSRSSFSPGWRLSGARPRPISWGSTGMFSRCRTAALAAVTRACGGAAITSLASVRLRP